MSICNVIPPLGTSTENTITTDGGPNPASTHTLESLKQWCKDNGEIYFIGPLYVHHFSQYRWSQVIICNRSIGTNVAEIVIINEYGIVVAFTTRLAETTPSWITGQTNFTIV